MQKNILKKIIIGIPLFVTAFIVTKATLVKSNKSEKPWVWGRWLYYYRSDLLLERTCRPDSAYQECKAEIGTKTTQPGEDDSYDNGVQTENNTEDD